MVSTLNLVIPSQATSYSQRGRILGTGERQLHAASVCVIQARENTPMALWSEFRHGIHSENGTIVWYWLAK